MKRTYRFTHALLASSVFLAPFAFAQTSTVVTGVNTPGGPPPYKTSVAGNIEIAPTGSISGATDGVDFDAGPNALVVDPGNPLAINVSAAGNAVNVTTAGTGATITINTGSTVQSTGTGDALLIAGTPTIVTNSGTLQGGTTGSGVHVAITGTGAMVTNLGGIITTTGTGPSVLIDAGGSGLTLTNSTNGTTPGTISAIGTNDAIRINGNFTSIVNNTTSTTPPVPSIITAVGGNGINIATAATGDIQNYGTIQITGTSGVGLTGAINIAAAYNGNVTNNSGGIIQSTGGTGFGAAILTSNSFNNIINQSGGNILAAGTDFGIFALAGSIGTINNAGLIQSTSEDTIVIEGNLTGITNQSTGIIQALNNPPDATIVSSGAVTVINGLTNSGIIKSIGPSPAIDFQTFGAANIPLFQMGGTITGNVLLAGAGGANALTMTGGTIAGMVNSSKTAASTLNLSGGTITGGPVNIYFTGNTVNIAGTILPVVNSAGTGGNTYNATGGTFTKLNGMAGDVFSVNATYNSNPNGGTGVIANVPTITTTNAGTVFTAANTISGISNQILITPNTTMVADAGVGGISGTGALNIQAGGTFDIASGSSVNMGSANNLGNLGIANNASLNTTGAYTQGPGAFSPTIQDMTPTGFGVINVGTTATFNPGSNIDPQLGSGVFILNNFAFPVVQSGEPINGFGNITVVQPPSAILSFTAVNAPINDVTLIAHTKPLALVAEPDIPLAVAASLDNLIPTTLAQVAALSIADPELLGLFGQLQLLPDVQSVSAALMQLAPSFNYALPASSRISIDNAFDSVHARLEGLTRIGPIRTEEGYVQERDYELYNGVNYGDANVIDYTGGKYGVWLKGYATLLDQHKRHEIEGFKAECYRRCHWRGLAFKRLCFNWGC